jgi:mono/diheme cytochrome c family protein
MNRVALLACLCVLPLAGCGNSKPGSNADSAAAAVASPNPTVSRYDSGPRAGESEPDEAQATRGSQLFKDKGCSACHAFGTKLSGPDLRGVSMRRTAAWMENQILHPEVMVKEDPISRGLFATHALQMPNQGLQPDEARAVIEFLKYQDHEAGLTPDKED